MNSGPLLVLGLFFTMAASWLTFILGPQLQIGRMQVATNIVSALTPPYPAPYPGEAVQGAQVYRAEGCAACHTQEIRARSADIARFGVTNRASTGFDYLYDQPVLLGQVRVGPDLANVGLRFDEAGLLRQLYAPRAPGSVMPSYRYLFDKRKINFAPSPDALQLEGDLAAPAGYEIVPSVKAKQLAAYLLSRHQDVYTFYAPPPLKPKTNAPPAAATNAPAPPK